VNEVLNLSNHRIEAVELKLMDLENTITELNDVIITQYGEIDRLKENQEHLKIRLAEIDAKAPVDGAAEPPPPHY